MANEINENDMYEFMGFLDKLGYAAIALWAVVAAIAWCIWG
jgi:hypothetical protein